MLQRFILSIFIFYFSSSTFSQTGSCHLRVSLLTCNPGEELYSTFGHSAIRVTDSATNQDVVYNYGTFNFDEPGFYTKFIRGKLMYYLSAENFNSFKQSYEQEKRGMTEQVLNLSCNEKQKTVQLLYQNLQGENKFYKYDFLFDNCTTRLRDLLENAADSTIRFAKIVEEKTTFRELIYKYLDYNDKQWSKLGIDILLGAKTDAVMNDRQVMFLPDYLMKSCDSSRIGSKVVVSSKNVVINLPEENNERNFFSDPLFIFSLLLALVLVMSYSKNIFIQNFLKRFDGLIFFITGLAGWIIVFMWFGTDHIMTKNNYNLLWALPTNAVGAFFIHNAKKWTKKYFLITALLNSLVLLCWFFLPQHMDTSLIPIILLLIFRSGKYFLEKNNAKQIHSISK